MKRSFAFASAALAVVGLFPTSADAQLISQRTRGIQRICAYQVGRQQRERIVGLGEPCPPSSLSFEAPAARIPSLASLSGERRLSGRTVCIYSYAGRDYPHEIDVGRSCPLTPNLLPR